MAHALIFYQSYTKQQASNASQYIQYSLQEDFTVDDLDFCALPAYGLPGPGLNAP
jgi:phage gp45-like